jgi:FkbM family methyltransferase
MAGRTQSLADILEIKPMLSIVDVGASPLDGQGAWCHALLAAGRARLIGFEPDPNALLELDRRKGPHELYLPYAVGDGHEHSLHVCHAPGMTSLLPPNPAVLDQFHGFPEWSRVLRTVPVKTVRLDDVAEIADCDHLKLDIQGAELMALQHAERLLTKCVLLHVEVEFLPMYVGQPLFSEVELFLRERGFMFHRFAPLVSRVMQPLVVDNSPYSPLSQALWADAVFIRDLTRTEDLAGQKQLNLALLLHDLYGSHDVVLNVLARYDRREGTSLAATYFEALKP